MNASPHDPSDEELARLVQKQDDDAFSELMNRYTKKLMRYGGRFLSSSDKVGDIVQDVFVKVYEHINDFDSTRQFSPWIYRIAHNAFVTSLRKSSHEPLYLFDLDEVLPHAAYVDPSEGEKERQEMRVLLEKSLKGLRPLYREIIELYYFEDFSYLQIADILHIPTGTVGIRLSRARDALKKLIPKENI